MLEAAKGKDMDTIRSIQQVHDGQVHVSLPAEWANEEVEIVVVRKGKAARMAAFDRLLGSKKPKPGQPSMMEGLITDRNEDL